MKIWNARRETKNVVPPLRQLFIHSLSILIFHDSHQKETKRKHRTEWVERPAAPNYSIVSWLWSCLQFRAACVGNRSCCHHMSRSLSFVVYYPSAFSHRKSDGSTFDLHFIWWWLHGAATPHLVCLALHIEWNGNPFDISRFIHSSRQLDSHVLDRAFHALGAIFGYSHGGGALRITIHLYHYIFYCWMCSFVSLNARATCTQAW